MSHQKKEGSGAEKKKEDRGQDEWGSRAIVYVWLDKTVAEKKLRKIQEREKDLQGTLEK